MAGYINPIASGMGGLEFEPLPSDDIKKISVKKVHVTPALDSLLGPVLGGLHDPALGAILQLDADCTTCKLNSLHCTGHCGHIELPIQCYHPQFLETVLRLLRAKCVYCHHFRSPKANIHQTICALRLLQHGLLDDYQKLRSLHQRKVASMPRKKGDQDAMELDDGDEDPDDLMERRDRFVNKAIRKALKKEQTTRLSLVRNPVAIAARKEVIANFLKDVALVKTCTSCMGISPTYRKDRDVKIFRRPLAPMAREAMKLAGKHAANPLILLLNEQEQKKKLRKPKVNGWHKEDETMTDIDEAEEMDLHGAEDEIALRNALETTAQSKEAEIADTDDSQAYLTPTEVHAALSLLFEREQEVLGLIYAASPGRRRQQVSADMFFIRNVLVPPNKFRPVQKQGSDRVLEHALNTVLTKIIKAVNEMNFINREMRRARKDPSVPKRTYGDQLKAGVDLQEAVNALIDSPQGPGNRVVDRGIKQVLEKKEGLFRMNMMGKRVNFAARSVISPDPNIETNEIGVPLVFAKKLTYPEPVTNHNFEEMSKAVINGMDKYPGAAAIENENGMVLSLRKKTLEQRKALAKQLLTSTVAGTKGETGKKVHRHLQTGDVVIMNRQPTLHKPSMMGHRARVLTNQKTIRMHYANCNTYNADFDGDEMNMHFPQNELARTEALQIADTDHQYLSATAGKPLRGLIQDHISMGVQFTSRDVFFDREQYQQLLYSCLRPESFNTIYERIQMVAPAVFKPKMLWTGKQIVSTVLKNITPDRFKGINLTSKSSTSAEQWGESTAKDPSQWEVTSDKTIFRDTEQIVIFKDGEHLSGILDKNQLGPSAGGLVHSVYELYGHVVAGKLLSIMGRLLTRALNERAWSCGMDDLYLTKESDQKRRQELTRAKSLGHEVSVEYVTMDPAKVQQGSPELLLRLEDVLRNDDQLNGLDQVYKSKVKSITDNVSKIALARGLEKSFPRNQMQAMTLSGAKGSSVNANQISANLGQQVLEGRRVPTMVSGKTLPSFRAFETDPVAGGYISGRFLTGIRPQEYFFHAMSGREGLIDTAVKTAKSGYLQRCIVKGLEGLRTEYDTSVRESSNGSMVQFLYGEDGLEVTKQRHLREFTFLADNYQSVATLIQAQEVITRIPNNGLGDEQKAILKSIKKGPEKAMDPLTTTYPPNSNFGSTSESFTAALLKYMKENSDNMIRDKTNTDGKISKKTFHSIMDLKYMRSIVEAGEAVGVVAAQSVGEPSTQMTLNTFHLAGHSAKNVTLGIPRLREIIMTASDKIMTPTMNLKPISEVPADDAKRFAKSISKLSLAHVINELSVTERSAGSKSTGGDKLYDIQIELFDPEEYSAEYAITIADVSRAFESKFLPKLDKMIKDEFKKKLRESSMQKATPAVPDVGASVGRIEETRMGGARTGEREGGEDDIDEEADPDDAKDAAARGRREDTYDEPDAEERAIADQSDAASGSEDEEGTVVRDKPRSTTNNTGHDSDSEDSEDSEREARQKNLKSDNPHLKKFSFSRNKGKSCRIVLAYESSTPKLLLLPILEKCAHSSVIQSIPGLGVCTLFMEEVKTPEGRPVQTINKETGEPEELKEPVITTEGVNLLAMRDYQDIINPHTLYTNSVHDMLRLYGVEAARMTIVKEIDGVFQGHGISVNLRHLSLIADAMTQSGGYKAFSRNGIVKEGGSILAKMSFETVMGFLKEAVLYGESDPLLGPSARIVAGRRGNIGTGSFDIVMPVS